jgi:hypothetical protein
VQLEQRDASIKSLELRVEDGKSERERIEKAKIEAEGRAELLNRQVMTSAAAQSRLERQVSKSKSLSTAEPGAV